MDDKLDETFRINEPNVVSEAFDGEYVILNLANGSYYSLQESGNLLWAALVAGASPRAMLSALEVVQNPQLGAAQEFLNTVIELNLVRSTSPNPLSESAALLVRKLASIDSIPKVEVFDDLADLILADPVHDGDEKVGWPTIKPAAG
jgi:hypothetical protein